LPKTLHARLAIEAEKEGVSLNQYAMYKLSATA
ncbi:MAG: type II toxin-antitoxin system HicB family antitoxin, partial [Synergistaceae bacterium]|nr:type II toxin-antitoxin system HicB family antitoxin [Synergistaceae bacterium]